MIYPDEATLLAEAKRLVSKWQPLLLLQEWDIRCVALPEIEDRRAETEWHVPHHYAAVRLNLAYWRGGEDQGCECGSAANTELEETIVHELFHVRHAHHDSVTANLVRNATKETRDNFDYEQEHLTFLMARILVSLERRGQWNGVIRASEITGEPVWTNGAGIK